MRAPRKGFVALTKGIAAIMLGLPAATSVADTHYVSPGGGNTFPYTTWETAATEIQAAVSVAAPGDTILVTNGVYDSGSAATPGYSSLNRVVVTRDITVRSVNGPEVTIIKGAESSGGGPGAGAVRGAYMSAGVLSGFTVTNGHTASFGDSSYDRCGGGVNLYNGYTKSGKVTDCILSGNVASYEGGGSYEGELENCTLSGNSARSGGGSRAGTLRNCVILGNSADDGGGSSVGKLYNCALSGNTSVDSGGGSRWSELNNCTVWNNRTGGSGGGCYGGTLRNCIVYHNRADANGDNHVEASPTTSCTVPLPTTGAGNITNAPMLLSGSHIHSSSPCVGAGTAADATGVDIDGEMWAATPAIGCDQPRAPFSGPLEIAIDATYTNVAVGYEVIFSARIQGEPASNRWTFGDGTTRLNDATVMHAWSTPGSYDVMLTAWNDTHPAGVTAGVRVQVPGSGNHFVDAGNGSPSPPYATWATAATRVQDAVDEAVKVAGSTVWVTNGVYDTGGRVTPGYSLTNRLVVTEDIAVRSVNGPGATTIRGAAASSDDSPDAVRGVWMSAGTLSGFTISGGHIRGSHYAAQNRDGGGVNLLGGNAAVRNSVITDNSARSGGGVYGGAFYNCAISGNTAANDGGGSSESRLYNCTLTLNSALDEGGGSYQGELNNCIVYHNEAGRIGGNYRYATLSHCCTTPRPADGTGHVTDDPMLMSAWHIGAASPCVGAGSSGLASGADIDGDPWAATPAIGCDEPLAPYNGSLRVDIDVPYTTVGTGFEVAMNGYVHGESSSTLWTFGDGTSHSNAACVRHAWATPGPYAVVLTAFNDDHPGGVSATANVTVVTANHYVDDDSTTPTPPYTSWATAATTIQEAIDEAGAVVGATVWVNDGVYDSGYTLTPGHDLRNRVVITNAIIVRSVNGPQTTIIEGAEATGGGHGNDAVRGVYMSDGILRGFTVTNGHTMSYGDTHYEKCGGGINMYGGDGSVIDCVLLGNAAKTSGGGSYIGTLSECILTGNTSGGNGGGSSGGTLRHCTISSNSAAGSGAGNYGGTLQNCHLEANAADRSSGGGAAYATLENCVLTRNSARSGGGSYRDTLSGCVLWGNESSDEGGGAKWSTLYNCTVAGNRAGEEGGGAYGCTLRNCIVYHNSAEEDGDNYSGGTLDYSCTTPLPPDGDGNISDAPAMVGISHIHTGSPCVGAGSSDDAFGTDIDGEAWSTPPASGCDQPVAPFEGDLTVTVEAETTNATIGLELEITALIRGETASNRWDFGDGAFQPNAIGVRHAWSSEGTYDVVVTAYNDDNPGGVSATVGVQVVKSEYFVNAANPTPSPPYDSWATAATTIQAAVDEATSVPGSVVWVTNGVYDTGSTVPPGYDGATRVVISGKTRVRSVNGPEETIIKGAPASGGGVGWTAVRGVYMNDGLLCGFTVTNGHTSQWGRDNSGGGIFASPDADAVVSNCVISGNRAYDEGGGAWGGALIDCTLSGNQVKWAGGGSSGSTLIGCRVNGNTAEEQGGGASGGVLTDCTISSNTAGYSGGGASGATLIDCTVIGNTSERGGGAGGGELSRCTLGGNEALWGGGSYDSVLRDCTLSGNSATDGIGTLGNLGGYGGGSYKGTLYECTLEGNSAGRSGGGASLGTLYGCTLSGNSAYRGGGSHAGELHGCSLWGNTAVHGGGSHQSTLGNCTVVDNRATWTVGGSLDGTRVNSIVYYNYTPTGLDNYSGGTLAYSCTLPMPGNGAGNITNAPMLVSSSHIHRDSACVAAGSAADASGTDIDGENWAVPPAIGCDEPMASVNGSLDVRLEAEHADVYVGYAVGFLATVRGAAVSNRWTFGDGTALPNALYGVRHAWSAGGDYDVVLTAYNDDHPGGVSATTRVHVAAGGQYYVDVDNATPASPFTSWATAATTIQDAVDAASGAVGATVWVADGEYSVGTHATPGYAGLNRVVITNEITVRSVSGPATTVIRGAASPGGTNGPGAVRGVYMSAGLLEGFTITNGHTAVAGDEDYDRSGGGVNMYGGSGSVVDCVIAGNSASSGGGGSMGGLLRDTTISHNSAAYGGGGKDGLWDDCTVVGNSATDGGGGTYGGMLTGGTLTENRCDNSGGGSEYSTLRDCAITGNSAVLYGGGISGCTADNCTLSGNSANAGGGGSWGGTLTGCTLTGNTTEQYGGGSNEGTLTDCRLTGNSARYGGGSYESTLTDCWLSGNSAQYGGGSQGGELYGCTLWRNSAWQQGGGCNRGLLRNCAIAGNSAGDSGGGSYSATLGSCTVAANSAAGAGGSDGGTLVNCIVYYNRGGGVLDNYSGDSLIYCCTVPLPPNDEGNITNAPILISASHIHATSPCVGEAWRAQITSPDIDGETWTTPAIGCDDPLAPFTGRLDVAVMTEHTNITVGFPATFLADIRGEPASNSWSFGDAATANNALCPDHSWSATGRYSVVLTAYNDDNPAGVSATTVVHVAAPPEYYVNISNGSPAAPFTSWATAATSIQDAVDEAGGSFGSIVWVTNGVYASGATASPGASSSNRVTITNDIVVRSVNGPGDTVIDGGGTVRGVDMTAGVLSGFTVTNGQTLSSGDGARDRSGGGVNMYDGDARITNCVVAGNSAHMNGGGCIGGRVDGCTLTRNTAADDGGGSHGSTLTGSTLAHNSAENGGGASLCSLTDCRLLTNSATEDGGGSNEGTLRSCDLVGNQAKHGGGSYGGRLNHCRIERNTAKYGGGSYEDTLHHCAVLLNSCDSHGGGSYDSDLYGCAVAGNSAASGGGGTYDGDLYNCTITGNSALGSGGGMYHSMPRNCIIYYNTAAGEGDNYILDGDTYRAPRHTCTTPMPEEGTDNITDEPDLLGHAHIQAGSPCVRAGDAEYTPDTDIDGQGWGWPPAMGCDEPAPPFTGPLNVAIAAEHSSFASRYPVRFSANIEGAPDALRWTFGDGTSISDVTYVRHMWETTGEYPVVLTAYNDDNPGGVSATTTVQVLSGDHYVNIDNTLPAAPYANWATAATNIQDAVDIAGTVPGGRVWVTNGLYNAGATLTPGHTFSNRLVITNTIAVRSVNGPGTTLIDGAGAMRVVYMTAGVLSGFTITNGWAEEWSAGTLGTSGGGVYMRDGAGVVSNCVLVGNTASDGGGSYYGALHDCVLRRNSAGDGGGSYYGTLYRCTLSDNDSRSKAGGAYYAALHNCLLSGNSAYSEGGGSYGGRLRNCTLSHNSARQGGGCYFPEEMRNCIVYYNQASSSGPEYYRGDISYSCTTPEPSYGTGNITNDPQFVDLAGSNFHLRSSSPCIDAGNNASAADGLDPDGMPRPLDGDGNGVATVDMGAYELMYEHGDSDGDTMRDRWELTHGFDPTDPSDATGNRDGDPANNRHEHAADTDPSNSNDYFHVVSFQTGPTPTVHFRSSSNRVYILRGSSDLPGGVWSDVPGAGPRTGVGGPDVMVDTNQPPVGPWYRPVVRRP